MEIDWNTVIDQSTIILPGLVVVKCIEDSLLVLTV